MFADKVLEQLAKNSDRDVEGHIVSIASSVQEAQRFVMSPRAAETCGDVCDWKSINKSRDYLFLPAYLTWLEWVDPDIGRVAVLLGGLDSTVVGRIIVFLPFEWNGESSVTFHMGEFDFPGEGLIFELLSWEGVAKNSFEQTGDVGYRDALLRAGKHWDRVARTAIGSLALINTPHISIQIGSDLDRLNRSRYKKSKPPYLSYTDVDIRLDGLQYVEPNKAPHSGEMPLHHVRAHMRLVRGRMTIVRPHWRGNPAKGVRLQRHNVMLEDEKHGEWTGGPLPGPAMIKDDD